MMKFGLVCILMIHALLIYAQEIEYDLSDFCENSIKNTEIYYCINNESKDLRIIFTGKSCLEVISIENEDFIKLLKRRKVANIITYHSNNISNDEIQIEFILSQVTKKSYKERFFIKNHSWSRIYVNAENKWKKGQGIPPRE
ncbi:hypothetical protein [Aureispira sp. CCB-E]|uniref:hypothetical protein n=1 Tax=Aureispira sp. CCB-E TaxID=3051121 RepID=UPI002868A915|nr:hypothetical protein [Aureispira sp. CCB-E]WMX16442.1 hypothetical protein QP953_08685 [Aureispira sp. CCB-E]